MISISQGLRAFRAGKIYTPDRVIADGVLTVRNGRIEFIGPWRDCELESRVPVTDMRPHSMAAGFIDIHVHGAAGHDFMDAEDEGFEAISKWHAKGGTTGLLATTCAGPLSQIRDVLERVESWQAKANQGARVLGAHVEGPFFNMGMRGCHLPEYIRDPTPREIDALLEHADAIKNLTIAPELDGSLEAIEKFAKKGITVSVAHSDATSDDIEAAVRRGLRNVTHLYNAMSIYHRRGAQRISGVVESALARDDLTVELIADGLHVNRTRLALALKTKTADRICLVTDAMRGAGMPDGLYAFGTRQGKMAVVRDGRALMPEGTGHASSVVSMKDCVRVMVELSGATMEQALGMASLNPARIIGVDDRKGSLETGKDADFVVLDEKLEVRLTAVGGHEVYQAEVPA